MVFTTFFVAVIVLLSTGNSVPLMRTADEDVTNQFGTAEVQKVYSQPEGPNPTETKLQVASSDDAIYRFIKLYREYESALHRIAQTHPSGGRVFERDFQNPTQQVFEKDLNSKAKQETQRGIPTITDHTNRNGVGAGAASDRIKRTVQVQRDGWGNVASREDVDVDDEDIEDYNELDKISRGEFTTGRGRKSVSTDRAVRKTPPAQYEAGTKRFDESLSDASSKGSDHAPWKVAEEHPIRTQATKTPTPIVPAHVVRSKLLGARVRQRLENLDAGSGVDASGEGDCLPRDIDRNAATDPQGQTEQVAFQDDFEDSDDEALSRAWEDFGVVSIGNRDGYQPVV